MTYKFFNFNGIMASLFCHDDTIMTLSFQGVQKMTLLCMRVENVLDKGLGENKTRVCFPKGLRARFIFAVNLHRNSTFL